MRRYLYLTSMIAVIVTAVLCIRVSAKAAEPSNPSGLPDVIVSQSVDATNNTVGVEVTSPSGKKYYGGLSGQEAILNYEPGYVHGFESKNVLDCRARDLPTTLCFVLEYLNSSRAIQPTSIQVMSGRSYRNGSAGLETAALLYPENLIVGDVYGFNNSNFTYSYFGKNLRLTPDNSASNSFWNLPGYIFNPQAQAFWNTGAGDKNATMNTTIERLKSNSVSLRNNIFDAYFSWQKKPFDGVCGNPTSNCREKNQYPEGRIWYTPGYARTDTAHPGMEISGVALNYQNKATTIIQQGNVKISTAIKNQDESSALGIIVRDGNVVINNPTNKKMTIVADIFVPNGTINILNSNIEMIGSFVAKDFQFNSDVSNISFIYHQRNDSAWPPGFRDLQLPSLLAK